MPTSLIQKFKSKFKKTFAKGSQINSSGFTLIELLVVTALMGILSTVVLANYNSFGARQAVRNTAEEFKTELRKYQTFATAGHKNPDQSGDCSDPDNILEYYQIEIDVSASPPEYKTTVVCTLDTIILPTKNFPENITVIIDTLGACNNPLIIRFYPLNQGALICPAPDTPVSPVDIKFSRSGTEYFVRVTDAGEVQVHK